MTDANQSRPLVRAQGVTRTFSGPSGEVSVLRGVDLCVHPSESVAIFGPSGSGKSTLLHCLGALDLPTAGELEIFGHDVSLLDDDERAGLRIRHIGFVFQAHHLLPQLTAIENVLLPTLADGAPEIPRQAAAARAADLLEEVGLAHRRDHRPAALSVGEQARVALARALVNDPDLIIADEPTGSLDRDSADLATELLQELQRSSGVALVVATHDARLAEGMDCAHEIVGGVLQVSTR